MIWELQAALTRRLLLWSAVSVAAGALLLLFGDPFWRGFGLQAVAWGIIDAGIAIFGERSSARRRRREGSDRGVLAREARNLRRLLWINTGLDVLYVAGGLALAFTLGAADAFARGNGWGIVLQGGFLFFLDLFHALAVPRDEPGLPPVDMFDGPEHRAFSVDGREPAALLLHGFMGTPAEMRPIADALIADGWTVHAPLLPGFGDDIQSLTVRSHDEWADAALAAASSLRQEGHAPLLLVGFSMGAALSLIIARESGAKGLALLAPFTWAEPRWLPWAEFFVRPFLPLGFRPMRKADFADPQVRANVEKFMPGIDLSDGETQRSVRDFRVPLGIIDQLRAVSRRAKGAARKIDLPVLVVQGTRDSVVRPEQTVKLVSRLPVKPHMIEVDSEHNLTAADNPSWPETRRALIGFAESLKV